MLGRSSVFIKAGTQPVADIPQNVLACMSVRWRKRRWVPKAPSKIFKVPVKPVFPEEEVEELNTRMRSYKNTMRSLRTHLQDEYRATLRVRAAETEVEVANNAAHWQQMLAYNDAWNAQSAGVREARIAAAKQEQQERHLQAMLKQEAEQEEKRLRAQELVAQTQAASQHFLTEENMEAAIEQALDNPVQYNYAIDTQGNRYVGLDMTKDTGEPEEVKVTQESGAT